MYTARYNDDDPRYALVGYESSSSFDGRHRRRLSMAIACRQVHKVLRAGNAAAATDQLTDHYRSPTAAAAVIGPAVRITLDSEPSIQLS